MKRIGMCRTRTRWSTWRAVVGLALMAAAGLACSKDGGEGKPSGESGASDQGSTAACADWRVIADSTVTRLAEDPPTGWSSLGLAGDAEMLDDECGARFPRIANCPARLPAFPEDQEVGDGFRRLKRFHRLELRTASAQRQIFSSEAGDKLVPGVDRDCMALTSAAEPELLVAAGPRMRDLFFENVGRLGAEDQGEAGRVHLVILDTLQTGDEQGIQRPNPLFSASNASHGSSLANIAKKLLCPGGGIACGTTIGSNLALRYLTFDRARSGKPDPERGGLVGFIGDMAHSIQWEVRRWKERGDGSKLILNISAGWEDAIFATGGGGAESDPEQMRQPVAAVYSALEFAACQGALVVAAAGNRVWGPGASESVGPVYPAAWADRQVKCGPRGVRPLLYSASAVGANGSDLVTERPGARPPFVAYGDHATVRASTERTEHWTPPLTGSSVGTLVVSAAAAAVWQLQTGLEPAQVMREVWEKGTPLPPTAGRPLTPDFGHRHTGWGEVRQVRVGPRREKHAAPAPLPRTMENSVARVGCQDAETPPPDWDWRPTWAWVPSEIACSGYEVRRLSRASDGSDLATGKEPEQICPHLWLESLFYLAGSETQPPSAPCGACMGGSVYIEIDHTLPDRLRRAFEDVLQGDEMPDVCLKDIAVQVGNTIYSLEESLGPGDRLRIPLEIAPGDRALLAGVLWANGSPLGASVSPIFTGPRPSGAGPP